ncbi:hypothetical protein [Synechococcus elongatus]|uniref:Uncharacterized protein n=1 Tax=Synechococcus elongatus PCC 11802 TaxID=2283154 RepID=A0AAU6R596_SYNEL|nr:hypothetical protein [Synechococcus elongatus]
MQPSTFAIRVCARSPRSLAAIAGSADCVTVKQVLAVSDRLLRLESSADSAPSSVL